MSELRFDPIKKVWSVIAVERSRRPHDFLMDHVRDMAAPEPVNCPFCPGNEAHTPHQIYSLTKGKKWLTRVIPNKFPAFRIEGDLDRRGHGLYDAVNGIGAHEIIIESPEHNLTLKNYTADTLMNLFTAFRARLQDLGNDIRFRYILAFKNYGLAAGASLTHPHSQVIALPILPNMIKTELTSGFEHFHQKERCLFCDVLYQERADEHRIVYENYEYIAFCPYASSFPFELSIYPKRHSHDFTAVSDDGLRQLADIMREALNRLGAVLEDPPLNFIIHTAPPVQGREMVPDYVQAAKHAFHWHIEIQPRLNRIAGFEWGTGFFINPVKPEEAAGYLREAVIP